LGGISDSVSVSDEESFLKSFCSQIFTVIKRSVQEQLRKDAIQGELVQKALMPERVPESNGCLDIAFSFCSARFLGGDFFDFYSFDNGRKIGILISDVSGKGIGPALFGSSCKAYLSFFSARFSNPGAVLSEANKRLCAGHNEGLFATVFYCIIDFDKNELSFSSAGHNGMILFNADNDMELLKAGGLPLGFMAEAHYETCKKEISGGERLFLYTDGVVELEDPELRLYGLQRLLDFLQDRRDYPAERLKLEMLAEIDTYSQGQPQSDDITFIVADIKKSV
jgi:sigma-B regulation protein RsbU (phosphoserine phosphatase)